MCKRGDKSLVLRSNTTEVRPKLPVLRFQSLKFCLRSGYFLLLHGNEACVLFLFIISRPLKGHADIYRLLILGLTTLELAQ